MKIQGARVLVTGGGRGLGREFAMQFLDAGARVMVCDVVEADLQASAEEAKTRGKELLTGKCDVTNEEDVRKTFATMVEGLGGIDVLINNAGITRDGMFARKKDGEIKTMSVDQWRKVIDVNLTGVFLCAREAVTWMMRKGNPGVVINISSVSRAGNMGQANYSTTKAGVVAFTIAIAKELAREGIRAACIAPGYTATEMVLSMREDVQDKVKSTIPLRRFAEPSEIARTALFIVENDYVTGRVFEIDGGLRL